MKPFHEMAREYQKRQRDTVVDTIATGLTYMDEIAVETGVLEETGLLTELTEAACGALPFVMIAATEGTKVVLGKKTGKSGMKDGAFRMAKTGAAMSIGGAVTAAGFWAALPVTMGVRAMFDRYRSKALTNHRVQGRIDRLRELRELMAKQKNPEGETSKAETVVAVSGVVG